MVEYRLIKRSNITKEEENIWRDMCSKTMRFASPILLPQFSAIIDEIRGDVEVLVARENGVPVGFSALHKRSGKIARPAGAPFSDYTAFVSYEGAKISLPDALEAVGIDRLQVIGLVDPYGVCGTIKGEEELAYGIEVHSDVIPNSLSKKHQKNYRRIKRHLIDDYGEEHFIFNDRNEDHFRKMIEFKRKQTVNTGVHDFLGPEWVEKLMEKLFFSNDPEYHGCMITLMTHETPMCFHFGPRVGNRMHPWIATYDQEFFQYSPGQIFLVEILDVLKAQGVEYYDLSVGESRYKSTFSNDSHLVRHGKICRTGLVAKQDSEIWDENTKIGKIHNKLRRRIDQISCLELDLSGRIKGIGFAFANATKRISDK